MIAGAIVVAGVLQMVVVQLTDSPRSLLSLGFAAIVSGATIIRAASQVRPFEPC